MMFKNDLVSRLRSENRREIAFQETWQMIYVFLDNLQGELEDVIRANPEAVQFDLETNGRLSIAIDHKVLAFQFYDELDDTSINVLVDWEVKDKIRFRDGEMICATIFPEQTISEELLDKYLEFAFGN